MMSSLRKGQRLARDFLEKLHHSLTLIEDRNDDGESVKLFAAWLMSGHGELDGRFSVRDCVGRPA